MLNLKPHWMVLLGMLLAVTVHAASTPNDAEVRKKLVRAILATGEEQQNLLGELGDSGSRTVSDVLTAWPRDEIMIHEAPDGSQIPAVLGEEEDEEGNVAATRIDNGEPLKDESGTALRFSTVMVTTAETDAPLRKAIQTVLDTLALADPDPNVRRSAILKLGNSQKPENIPVLKDRLEKESDAHTKETIAEAIALLQLNDPDPAVQIAAASMLGNMQSIGSLETLKRLAESENLKPEVLDAAKKAVAAIQSHISKVNFVGTIFRGLSL